jgi:SAM-dependent methyltransferase
MYLSPRPDLASIGHYYPENYTPYRPPVEDERFAIMRWVRQRKLSKRREMVERYSGRTSGRILDVGSSTGLFLHEMQKSGWKAVGVELNPKAAQQARQRYGLDVFVGTLENASLEANSFDIISFWDVLEHTFSPSSELARAAELLRTGGVLAISIPNWDSFDRMIFGIHWQGLDPPRHLYMFTRETLTAFLSQAGFDVLDWVCFVSGYFSFSLSLERLLIDKVPRMSRLFGRMLELPGIRIPFEPWFMLSNRLDKGGIVTIFARKRESITHQTLPQ